MRAVVCERYGGPEVYQVREVARPTPKVNDVLVRVVATTVTASGGFMRRGEPWFARLFVGLSKPKHAIQGTDLAGVVEAVGGGVTRFKPGDEVFAATDTDFGAYAEYVCVPEDGCIATKPRNMTFDEAASVCEGGKTALPFLRDIAKVRPGQRVLVNGASGAIGTFAVQLGKHIGAEVVGVCSGKNVELVRSLGADEVIDYTKDDFTRGDAQYDVIFDTVGTSSFSRCKRSLKQGGAYLSPVLSMGLLVSVLTSSVAGDKKAKFSATGLRSVPEKTKDLVFLKELIEAGKLKSVIDRRYPLEQIVEAARYVDGGHKRGNVVLVVSS